MLGQNFISTEMNFLPKNVHEISFPLGGKIPPTLGQKFFLTCAHEIDPWWWLWIFELQSNYF